MGTGALGVGGIGITVWQTTESEDAQVDSVSRDDTPLVKEDHNIPVDTSPLIPPTKTPDIKMVMDDDFLSSITEQAHNGLNAKAVPFGLSGYGCFKNFFPGTDVFLHDRSEHLFSNNQRDGLLVKDPVSNGTGNIQGCTTMVLSHKNDKFLFKSETVIKNDKVALALWTGVKRGFNPSPDFPSIIIRVSQYLTFLEFDESGKKWTFKGGYSWTPSDANISVSSLTIKSPDETSINQTFTPTTSSSETKWTNKKYSGIWESPSSGKGNSIFTFNESNYTPVDRSVNEGALIFSPYELRGYKEADLFYESASDGSDYWCWYHHKQDLSVWGKRSLDVSDSISKWYEPFKNSRGSWKSLDEHCKSRNDGICKDKWYEKE